MAAPVPAPPALGDANANALVHAVPAGMGPAAVGAALNKRKIVETLESAGRTTLHELGEYRTHEHRVAALHAAGGAAAGAAAGGGAAAGAPPWFAAAMAPLLARLDAADARSRNAGCRRNGDAIVPLPSTVVLGAAVPAAFPANLGALRRLNGAQLTALEKIYGLLGAGTVRTRKQALGLHLTGIRDLA